MASDTSDIEEGELVDDFDCPECGGNVHATEVFEDSFEYECDSCGRTAVQFQ